MYETQINLCITECLAKAGAKKGSLKWFESYRRRCSISSVQQLDREIFVRMYGREPKEHERQKVRFWRLQQHLPGSREEAVLLGRALALTDEELDVFLQEGLGRQRFSPVEGREQMMEALYRQYLCRVSARRLAQLKIRPGSQQRYLRHIFYTDALDCVAADGAVRGHCYGEHLYSRNFFAEFKKYRMPDAVVSRENMLRILLLLLMPDLDEGVLDEWLVRMGFAPLNPDREAGGYVDGAVLCMLGICCGSRLGDMEDDRERMKRILRQYDRAVKGRINGAAERGEKEAVRRLKRLRFMKFRSVEEQPIAVEGMHG